MDHVTVLRKFLKEKGGLFREVTVERVFNVQGRCVILITLLLCTVEVLSPLLTITVFDQGVIDYAGLGNFLFRMFGKANIFLSTPILNRLAVSA